MENLTTKSQLSQFALETLKPYITPSNTYCFLTLSGEPALTLDPTHAPRQTFLVRPINKIEELIDKWATKLESHNGPIHLGFMEDIPYLYHITDLEGFEGAEWVEIAPNIKWTHS